MSKRHDVFTKNITIFSSNAGKVENANWLKSKKNKKTKKKGDFRRLSLGDYIYVTFIS